MTDISMHLNTDEIELWAQDCCPPSGPCTSLIVRYAVSKPSGSGRLFSSWSNFRSLRRAPGLPIA